MVKTPVGTQKAHPKMPNDVTPVSIASITVRRGRLLCHVSIPKEEFRCTTAALAECVNRRFPELARHACVNSEGKMFGAVMSRTSIPHLLEHLAIDFQTSACRDQDAVFVGTTEWLDESAGEALVQLSFKDDLAALKALRQALDVLNELLVGSSHGVES